MADYTPFPARVVTPEGVAFTGNVREIQVSSTAGGLGILAKRAPVVADLKMGRVRAQLEDGTWRNWATAEGFAKASDSDAIVVVEEAVAVEDISAEMLDNLRADLAKLEADAQAAGQVASIAKAQSWISHLESMNS